MARVVVTGVSSYTGACIASALSGRGHEVVGLCRRASGGGDRLVERRLALVTAAGVQLVFGVLADSFPDWVRSERLDAWVHHHHPMENFRSETYDTHAAERAVLDPLPALLAALAARGARLVIHSSTYFEPGEGGQPLDARVTPYAALKARVNAELVRGCQEQGLGLSRVVIPAPTGALENDDRLTPQLLHAAERSAPFVLRSPDSVMDLIPGETLAEAYVELVEAGLDRSSGQTRRPSGRVVTASAWAEEVGRKIGARRGVRLELEVPSAGERPAPVRFENPSAERRAVDWDAFFSRYARDWQG